MEVALGPEQMKPYATLGSELFRVVAADIETAALIGTIGSEGRHDGGAPRPQRPLRESDVSLAILRVGEEMEQCAVMPYIEPPKIFLRDHITQDPIDLPCSASQATLGDLEPGLRDVENRDLLKALIEEMIDEGRSSPSDVDDALGSPPDRFSDEPPRHLRIRFVPARLIDTPGRIHPLPITCTPHESDSSWALPTNVCAHPYSSEIRRYVPNEGVRSPASI
jgi:hypothetical protein